MWISIELSALNDQVVGMTDATLFPRIGLIACSVFEREIAMCLKGGGQVVEARYVEIALHDQPDRLRAELQAKVDEFDAIADLDAVVMAYGLCGLGTVGLAAGRHSLVFPRAHDCITVFLGSKEAYAAHQRRCPTCYYYTPGWNRARRVPGPDKVEAMREEFSRQYDEDDVNFLIDSERSAWAMHDTATYIDLGTDDAAGEKSYAAMCADFLGWKFEAIRGEVSLLRDLLCGPWDEERFQVVRPGETLAHRVDEMVMRTERAVVGVREGIS